MLSWERLLHPPSPLKNSNRVLYWILKKAHQKAGPKKVYSWTCLAAVLKPVIFRRVKLIFYLRAFIQTFETILRNNKNKNLTEKQIKIKSQKQIDIMLRRSLKLDNLVRNQRSYLSVLQNVVWGRIRSEKSWLDENRLQRFGGL